MNLKKENERQRCEAQIVDGNPYFRNLGVSVVILFHISCFFGSFPLLFYSMKIFGANHFFFSGF